MNITRLVDQLKALGDMTRLKVLKLLIGKEYCVCELAEIIGISQPGISQHLRKLKVAGFVTERKDSQWVYYKADDESLKGFLEDFQGLLNASVFSISELTQELGRIKGLEQNPIVVACKRR